MVCGLPWLRLTLRQCLSHPGLPAAGRVPARAVARTAAPAGLPPLAARSCILSP